MKKILYIHHCSVFGGASRSIYEAIKAFPDGQVDPYFLCAKGSASKKFLELTENVIETRGISAFDHTKFSYYRGRRWLVLLREFFFLGFTFFSMLKARVVWGKDAFNAIHINEITLTPVIIFAKILFKAPIICHCRSIQANNVGELRENLIRKIVNRYVSCVVAIDNDCSRSLSLDIPVHVIHNGLNVTGTSYFSNKKFQDKFTVGFVGNLLPSKGIYDLIECAKKYKQMEVDEVIFLIVGPSFEQEASIFDQIFSFLGFRELAGKKILSLITKYELDNVINIGFQDDISSVFQGMDILCFPSHLDAVGRPVFEAAYFGVPSVVAVTNPTPDTFIPNITGVKVRNKCPADLYDAIELYRNSPETLSTHGDNSRVLSNEYYNISKNSQMLVNLYGSV